MGLELATSGDAPARAYAAYMATFALVTPAGIGAGAAISHGAAAAASDAAAAAAVVGGEDTHRLVIGVLQGERQDLERMWQKLAQIGYQWMATTK